jgi:signal transduction histidine kinase
VEVDSLRLEQVFSNLLINAAKYTPNGGEIKVSMERLDSRISICIRDSGIGIEPAVLLRVFDMFAQADATAPCAEGWQRHRARRGSGSRRNAWWQRARGERGTGIWQ